MLRASTALKAKGRICSLHKETNRNPSKDEINEKIHLIMETWWTVFLLNQQKAIK